MMRKLPCKQKPGKVITFEKSALRGLCKMLGTPYDSRIIAFTKRGAITNIWDLVDQIDSQENV